MKLKYRGVAYEYNPTKIASIEGKVGGNTVRLTKLCVETSKGSRGRGK